MAILNYTTQINFKKTIAEIHDILARTKVQQISTDYTDGMPSGIRFMITYLEQPVYFRLPCNIDGVYKLLCNAPKIPNKLRNKEQAYRVAWRIIKDWIEAQLAIVESQQAQISEIFLPYMIDGNDKQCFRDLPKVSKNYLLRNRRIKYVFCWKNAVLFVC